VMNLPLAPKINTKHHSSMLLCNVWVRPYRWPDLHFSSWIGDTGDAPRTYMSTSSCYCSGSRSHRVCESPSPLLIVHPFIQCVSPVRDCHWLFIVVIMHLVPNSRSCPPTCFCVCVSLELPHPLLTLHRHCPHSLSPLIHSMAQVT
jgi:hypothetical protein